MQKSLSYRILEGLRNLLVQEIGQLCRLLNYPIYLMYYLLSNWHMRRVKLKDLVL